MDDLFDAKYDSAVDSFFATHNVNTFFFDWDTVLDWEVPKSSCPKSSNPTECDYLDAYFGALLPSLFYCILQYDSASSCSSDQLCAYDYETSTCGPVDEVRSRAFGKAILTLLDRVEAKVDRVVLNATISCPTITDESDCKEHCRWDIHDDVCKTNMTFIYNRMAEAGRKTWRGKRDPVCRRYAFIADTACYDIDSTKKCRMTDKCEWKVGDDCGVSDETFIQLALDKADDVDASLESLWFDCAGYTTKQKCLAAKA